MGHGVEALLPDLCGTFSDVICHICFCKRTVNFLIALTLNLISSWYPVCFSCKEIVEDKCQISSSFSHRHSPEMRMARTLSRCCHEDISPDCFVRGFCIFLVQSVAVAVLVQVAFPFPLLTADPRFTPTSVLKYSNGVIIFLWFKRPMTLHLFSGGQRSHSSVSFLRAKALLVGRDSFAMQECFLTRQSVSITYTLSRRQYLVAG